MNDENKMKKVFLPESQLPITLRCPSKVEGGYVFKGWMRGELSMIKSDDCTGSTVAMYKAYQELMLDISVLDSDLLTEWEKTAGKGRWDFILLNVYYHLLQNQNTSIDSEAIRYAVGEPNNFFTSAIIVLLRERIKTNEIKFINALNMAKYHLREHFIHPLVRELVDGFLEQWVEFSLGHAEVMYEWDEVIKITQDVENDNFSTYPLPSWMRKILYFARPPKVFVSDENSREELIELLTNNGHEVAIEISEAAVESFSEMFEPVEGEEQPIPRGQTMKGNGRRELTYKNGYTFPKPKGRW